MTERQPSELDDETCLAYLEGELDAARRAEVEAVLSRDPFARQKLESLRRITVALAAPVDELADFDLAGSVRTQLREPATAPRPARWPYGLAAAACLAALSIYGLAALPGEEFRAKTAGSGAREADRWSAVHVFRTDGPRAEPLGSRLAPGEGVAFSYTNLGPRPFTHLMVFGVDASDEVRWFHPAFEQAGQDPTSIRIEPGADVALRERIEHDYARGPLAIHVLFSRNALRVSEVEAQLRESRAVDFGADTHHQIIRTTVAP